MIRVSRFLIAYWLIVALSIVAFAGAALLGGCSTVACVKPAVNLPEPVLPEIDRADLKCLSSDVFKRLALRDLELQGALRECRAVVQELTE